jgi:hypothetical protein
MKYARWGKTNSVRQYQGSGHSGDVSSETRPTCTAGASEDLHAIRRNLGHVAGKALVAPEIIVEIQATGWRSWELQIDVIAGSTGIPFARK